MTFYQKFLWIFLLLWICLDSHDQNKVLNVNPFIGSSGVGHTTPGAKYPFGMIYISPISSISATWHYCSGYQHLDKTFVGLSHTALSGTGLGELQNIIVSPFRQNVPILEEYAEPGYYSVNAGGVLIEATVGLRYGIHKYNFQRQSKR